MPKPIKIDALKSEGVSVFRYWATCPECGYNLIDDGSSKFCGGCGKPLHVVNRDKCFKGEQMTDPVIQQGPDAGKTELKLAAEVFDQDVSDMDYFLSRIKAHGMVGGAVCVRKETEDEEAEESQ